jgi:hypothetical protein
MPFFLNVDAMAALEIQRRWRHLSGVSAAKASGWQEAATAIGGSRDGWRL